MDPILLTVVFKGAAMLLAIGGGMLIARYGFHLYKDGAGAGRDRIAFEVGPVKIQAYSVGSAAMATAFLWAWAGVSLSPNLDKKGDEWRIYSLSTPQLNFEGRALTATSPKPDSAVQNDPETLKSVFKDALTKGQKLEVGNFAVLNGKPAEFDLQSIQTMKARSGYLVSADVTTPDVAAAVSFEPIIAKGKLVFVPVGVEWSAVRVMNPRRPEAEPG
jgi:hypothetical protein